MNSSGDNQTVSVCTSKLTPAADIWVGLINFIVVVLSVLGNGLVLLISYCSRTKVVGWEVLCINLALADFFCCILLYPLSISSTFQHIWLGGRSSCTYYGFGHSVFSLCSVLTITAVSGLRYLKVRHCSVYADWIKRANIQRACCFIWLVATVWSSFPLLGWGEYVPDPYRRSCGVAWRSYHASAKDDFYVFSSLGFFTLPPFLLIVVTQYSIILALSCGRLRCPKKQLTWMFCFITLGFMVTWLPSTIVSFLFFVKGHQYMPPASFLFAALFAKTSHVYKPFIYFYFNENLQKEFCRLFCSFWGRQQETGVDTDFREGEGNPPPIEIQVQDRSRPQKKKKKSLSKDKSEGSVRREDRAEEGSSSPRSISAACTCWEENPGGVSEKEPAQVTTLV